MYGSGFGDFESSLRKMSLFDINLMNYKVDGIFNQSHGFKKILNSYELENLKILNSIS